MVAKIEPKQFVADGPASDNSEVSTAERPAQILPQRKIPGNLPYLTGSGTLKKVLDKLQEAARPDKFNADFLENVLKQKGGSARATIPILKKMGFLASDSTPTELYAKFRTEGGRGQAALQGLRSAFPEIFKRSEYAHSVDDAKIKDIIVEITGLKANDVVASAIRSTFNVVKSYIPTNYDTSNNKEELTGAEDTVQESGTASSMERSSSGGIGLSYNINIVLPETSDLKILNAIFRSIKENLMR